MKKTLEKIAIILSVALLFFVLTILIIQKYNNITATNQIYGIALANAMFGAVVGIGIISIIYCLKDKRILSMIIPTIISMITIIFFALGLATLNTNSLYFYIGFILLFVTMCSCVLVQVISIIQVIRGKIEISEKSEQ